MAKKKDNFKSYYNKVESVKGFKEAIEDVELTKELLKSLKSGKKNNIGYNPAYYDKCFKVYVNLDLNKYYMHGICDHILLEFESRESAIDHISNIRTKNNEN